MTTSETDLELLEEYLDGALSEPAQSKLRDRLQHDDQLAASLKELQSQRDVRLAAWRSMEPDSATAEQLTWRVRGAMLDQQRNHDSRSGWAWSQWRVAGVSSAAAACVVLGFFFGRLGHNGATTTGVTSNVTTPGIAVIDQHSAMEPAVSPIARSGFVPVGNTARISVPITNEYGQVVAWQTFDNPEQAKNFTEDLHRATPPDANAPATSGQIKTVGEQF